jgi:hypothetical protein
VNKARSMKRLLRILLILFVIFSCKKENVNPNEGRCGTVFVQPVWAKNFRPDSLYSVRSIIAVMYSNQTPFSPHWDTVYNLSVPIKFLPGGYGELSNSVTFHYSIKVTQSMPEILIDNITDLSSVFPFANSFLDYGNTIELTIENYSEKGGQLYLDNEKASLNHIYESSYMSFNK